MTALDILLPSIAIGIGATVFMDTFAWFRTFFFKVPGLNYALAGRWVISFLGGQFFHDTIVQSPPHRYERVIGWLAHYGIGIFFVFLMLVFMGLEWSLAPNILNPFAMSVLSLSVPLLAIQPAFGFGLAGSKTASPWIVRKRSLMAHLSFGMGIYLAGLAWSQLFGSVAKFAVS